MTPITSREIRLASRPTGRPGADNFSLAQAAIGPPGEGHVLVRNLFMSVDPYMRGRMNDMASYVPPFELGKPLDGGAVGEVVESRASAFKPGDAVVSNYGWREYFVAPDGIDVYFDNVAGETLEAALSALRVHGRIIACGAISMYNDQKPRRGPSNLFNMITKRLTMKGLIVTDWLDRQAEFQHEVGGYLRAGTLISKETVVNGIEEAVRAFMGLFDGTNVGKMVVTLG